MTPKTTAQSWLDRGTAAHEGESEADEFKHPHGPGHRSFQGSIICHHHHQTRCLLILLKLWQSTGRPLWKIPCLPRHTCCWNQGDSGQDWGKTHWAARFSCGSMANAAGRRSLSLLCQCIGQAECKFSSRILAARKSKKQNLLYRFTVNHTGNHTWKGRRDAECPLAIITVTLSCIWQNNNSMNTANTEHWPDAGF